MSNDLREYVERIAEELKEIYNGEWTDEEREEREEHGEACDFWEYFEDVLDIEYIIGGRGEYRGCELAVTLGGPNVYINTRDGEVKGFWGSDKETAWVPSEICNEIDEIFEEYYNSL